MKFRNIMATFGLAFIMSGCAGQELYQPISESDRTFERVVEAPGYSKEEIYTSTKIWIAENFNSAKSVIEIDSEKDGLIIGNGMIQYPCEGTNCFVKGDWKVPFTMRVDMKDERFKLSFINIQLSWPGYDGPVNAQADMDAIKPALLEFGDEILASMKASENSDDW